MRNLALLILPEFSSLGLAAAIEPLFVANWLAQEPLYEWKIISTDGLPVRASNGTTFAVGGDLAAAAGCRSVFVLASFDTRGSLRHAQLVRWLKRIARHGTELGGIENGSILLAEAGLLNGLEVAVHWDNLIGFRENFPAARAVTQLFTRGRQRVTCAGAAAVLDLMIAWIDWHGEPDLAAEVAAHLLLGTVRSGAAEQRTPSSSASGAAAEGAVASAQQLMRDHIEAPLSCAEIGERIGLSLRQIERRFRQELGCSVVAHYRQIRLAKAHRLLQQTTLSVTEVALSCGFSSPEHFCRVYRRMFDRSPSTDRRQSAAAPVLRLRSRSPRRSKRGDS